MTKNKFIEKYFRAHAEPECDLIKCFHLGRQFKNCIAIPACDEKIEFVQRLAQHRDAKHSLLILVINQHKEADQQTTNNNLALHWQISKSATDLWNKSNLRLVRFGGLHILLVDRFSESLRLDKKAGVGRARKIACDLAVALQQKGIIQSDWIYSTDADACLPDNYFDSCTNNNAHKDNNSYTNSTKPTEGTYPIFRNCSARVFDFQHTGKQGSVLEATLLYERALKYFQAGLQYATSPYAFYTLGSTLAFHIEAYCQVRGFPARPGGEDFYLLNKLAKVGNITFCPEITIQLQARLSERVPFGTGPAVKKILERIENNQPYLYYNPHIFLQLKAILTKLPVLWEALSKNADWKNYFDEICILALKHIDIEHFLNHCKRQNIKERQLNQAFHTWFDAFRTLKFIHFLQAERYPAVAIEDCEQALKQNFSQNLC